MQEKKCQFYIVLGVHDFKPILDGNVYINATGVQDFKLVEKAIFDAYGKKSSQKIPVSSEIVFLIEDRRYEEQCQKMMESLRLNGRIEVLPKKEEAVVTEVPPATLKEEVNSASLGVENTSVDSSLLLKTEVNGESGGEEKKEGVLEEVPSVKEIPKYSYKPGQDNVYHGDIDVSNEDGGRGKVSAEAANYMGYNPTLINSNVKTLVKKPTSGKSAGFAKLPVIVFVLSALLLIASVILLFVLD